MIMIASSGSQSRAKALPGKRQYFFALGGFALAMCLAGCAAPPEKPQGDLSALKRVRFEDSPGGARAILDESILFKRGETTFANSAEPVLDVLKPAFDRARGQVVIEGHTDTVGSDAYNLKLSQDRAEKVRTAMIARQFPPSRLIAKGFGESMLKRKPEVTNEDARLNRRAEIVFIGETVASLNGREVENKAESMLDQLANSLRDAGKKLGNAIGGVIDSIRK
jgi:outer membrane protein OmpA-like peptidoglycan-associated protein